MFLLPICKAYVIRRPNKHHGKYTSNAVPFCVHLSFPSPKTPRVNAAECTSQLIIVNKLGPCHWNLPRGSILLSGLKACWLESYVDDLCITHTLMTNKDTKVKWNVCCGSDRCTFNLAAILVVYALSGRRSLDFATQRFAQVNAGHIAT